VPLVVLASDAGQNLALRGAAVGLGGQRDLAPGVHLGRAARAEVRVTRRAGDTECKGKGGDLKG